MSEPISAEPVMQAVTSEVMQLHVPSWGLSTEQSETFCRLVTRAAIQWWPADVATIRDHRARRRCLHAVMPMVTEQMNTQFVLSSFIISIILSFVAKLIVNALFNWWNRNQDVHHTMLLQMKDGSPVPPDPELNFPDIV